MKINLFSLLFNLFRRLFHRPSTQLPQGEVSVAAPDAPTAPVSHPPVLEAPAAPPAPPVVSGLYSLWGKCMYFMEGQKMFIDYSEGGYNLVFVAGRDLNGDPIQNAPDGWNDLVFVARMKNGAWDIPFSAECTMEPGKAPTFSKGAKERGGVAWVVPGQYGAWKISFHKQKKYGKAHPAFVQCKPILVSRDFNADLARNGDKVYEGVFGINIHAQHQGADSKNVGFNSEGCLVLRWFEKLQELIALAKDFNIYKKSGPDAIFAATIIAEDLK